MIDSGSDTIAATTTDLASSVGDGGNDDIVDDGGGTIRTALSKLTRATFVVGEVIVSVDGSNGVDVDIFYGL